ncbi:hypothetical protein [Endozoicomonas sp. 4G]|uniref:hypothetical protein n=1 Tax=Endozoicomonas sp. 4G TaxID=2872754 RepID=UPI002078F180|nr:hypothetical protein [Endozoicomonas sp. 4G]
MAAGLSTILGFFTAWMSHESPWVYIATDTPEDFNPHCHYQVEFDQTWFFAAAVNKDALLLTPYGSLENADTYVLKISATQKNSLIIKSNGSTSEQPLGFESIRRWCPSAPEKIDLNNNNSFNLSQRQNIEWKEFPDADSTKKVIEQAKDKKLQASSFNRNCFYRVKLDNNQSWQTAFGTDNGGFTLYINTYFPDSVTGTQKTIDWMTTDQYTRTREGEEKSTGQVRRIQYFCPE